MKKINNLGTITYEEMIPAKLIIGDKEINVVVKTVEQYNDEKRNDLLEPIILNGFKYAVPNEYETRVYICEEHATEYGNFL